MLSFLPFSDCTFSHSAYSSDDEDHDVTMLYGHEIIQRIMAATELSSCAEASSRFMILLCLQLCT
jgi:hypothetical protein